MGRHRIYAVSFRSGPARYGKLQFNMFYLQEPDVNSTLEILEAEVLQLNPVDRSRLLERLIVSLDADPDVEAAWEREADRRDAEMESGQTQPVSANEAIARLRARLHG